MVFPEATGAEAEEIAQRVAENLAEAVKAGEVPPFTVSTGIADSTTATGHAEVIRTADEAMFRAKQAGRDRVVRSRPTPTLITAEPTMADERQPHPGTSDPADRRTDAGRVDASTEEEISTAG